MEKLFCRKVPADAERKRDLLWRSARSHSDKTAGKRYFPSASSSLAIEGQPGVVVSIAIPSLEASWIVLIQATQSTKQKQDPTDE
jgi:hypothetical protein